MKLKNTHTHKTNDSFFVKDIDFPLRAMHLWQVASPKHRHEFSECVLILDGGGLHQCEDHAPSMLRRGDILVIPPGGYHAYLKGCRVDLVNVLFQPNQLPSVLMELYSHVAYKELFMQDYQLYGERDYPCFNLPDARFSTIETLGKLLANADRRGHHCYRLGLFMALPNLICDSKPQADVSLAHTRFDLPQALSYIEAHIAGPLSLKSLASHSGVPVPTYLRNFRKATGALPMEHIRRLRMHRAERLLCRRPRCPARRWPPPRGSHPPFISATPSRRCIIRPPANIAQMPMPTPENCDTG
ncbi:MAG: AraC family ligand binding domain-containing protein [Victivallales bacterium]|nr:AraC family ligand binding domain-containing protein [Victivallales bacterium]